MVKKCSRCNEEKSLSKFKMDKRQLDGRTITCRDCYKNNKLQGKWIPSDEQKQRWLLKVTGKKRTIEQRLNLSLGQQRVVKEGRHHWKKNEVPNRNQERTHLVAKIWREQVLELKGRFCEKCKSKDRLHVHHIKCFQKFPELRTDINNGQVLCSSCHMRVHRLDRSIAKE